eukprot:3912138-Pyramimonas_sp.AAC.1
MKTLCPRFRNHCAPADLKRMALGGADRVEYNHVLLDVGGLEPWGESFFQMLLTELLRTAAPEG